MKLCPKCDQEKNLEDFHNERKRKGGKAYWCKKCALKYRQDNAEKINAYFKEWNDQKKKFCFPGYKDVVDLFSEYMRVEKG
jgi:hypothetical protein